MKFLVLLTLSALAGAPSVLAKQLKIDGVHTNVEIERRSYDESRVRTEHGVYLPGHVREEHETIAEIQIDLKHTSKPPSQTSRTIKRNFEKRQTPTPVTGGLANVSPVPTVAAGKSDLYNRGQFEWSANIKIGSQTFEVLVDTGSADLWVAGSQCTNCGSRPKYTLSTSTGARNLSIPTASTYLGGRTVRGHLLEDTVTVGGVAVRSKFASVWDGASQLTSDIKWSGILGLAFTKLSPTLYPRGYYNWFEEAYRAVKFKHGIFGLYLHTTQNSWGGDLSIGGVNPAKYRGNIAWVKIVEIGTWKVNFNGINFGTTAVTSSVSKAVVDSGTNFILIPTADFNKITALIGGGIINADGTYGVDCKRKKDGSLPNITIKLDGNLKLTLTPAQYILYNPGDANWCNTAFLPSTGLDFWILGTNFLKAYYTAYNIGWVTANNSDAKIGFAVAYPYALDL
ncbi:hypothetical protein HK097_001568 [Rhizophlyctis rosea]|uniref:Peptidase A1 domain-containing protein n=1 Tax=Rhizophlyctis rosea TaxID=64517 RepID=A0AAD5X4D4_9FUNG|nr:hypothetical protein HK097_001568 [Rhizophlyctis rosea]